MHLSSKQFNRLRKTLIIVVTIGVFLSMAFDLVLIALISIGFGMFLMTFLKSSVRDKLVDERVESIANRAAMASFRVLLPILGITSVALLVSSGKVEFYYLHGLGVVLSYVTSLGLLVYLVAYFYFKRKYGG